MSTCINILLIRYQQRKLLKMKTIYPKEPIKDFKSWRAYIAKQVLDAKTERIINQFKQDLIKAYTKKQTK